VIVELSDASFSVGNRAPDIVVGRHDAEQSTSGLEVARITVQDGDKEAIFWVRAGVKDGHPVVRVTARAPKERKTESKGKATGTWL